MIFLFKGQIRTSRQARRVRVEDASIGDHRLPEEKNLLSFQQNLTAFLIDIERCLRRKKSSVCYQ